MNPAFAIEYLNCRFISPQQAVNRLGDLDEAVALLKIYHRFFPQEFSASRRRVIARAGDLQAALVECLELVSKHLFEITDYCFDGWQNEDLPLSYIPIEPIFGEWWNDDITLHVNPTGRFEIGGPHGDTGLTGRKIIVDTYGGRGRHGGGAFSGKDPTKVDRSAAYMARYIAKNIVAADLATQCEVQLSYAIGYPDPLNIWVTTYGTQANGLTEEQLVELIRKHFKLTPRGIIETLDLRKPIYHETARHGHCGRELPQFTWERTDKAAALRKEAGVAAVAR